MKLKGYDRRSVSVAYSISLSQTWTCVQTDPTYLFALRIIYMMRGRCAAESVFLGSPAICSHFITTSACIFQIPIPWQEPGRVAVLVRDSIPGRVRRAAVCHEAISESHMMHTIHMFYPWFYPDSVNKHVFCGARKASEHFAGNSLHFYWLNAHCAAEICSLISIEPVPWSLYFTYETLIWVLMRCM